MVACQVQGRAALSQCIVLLALSAVVLPADSLSLGASLSKFERSLSKRGASSIQNVSTLVHEDLADAESFMARASARLYLGLSTGFETASDVASEEKLQVPDKRQAMHFRAVSTTLWCVMILCIEAIGIYSALAFSRNHDELSGQLRPSVLTETLSVAARSANFSSMLAMLFVGCRMYVLATTEGLGEPPIWVKAGMIASTVGVTLQLLTVFMLPHATIVKEEEGEQSSFSARSGTQAEAFPALDNHEFHTRDDKETFWAKQYFSIVLIYGGAITVLVGIFTFPTQTTKVSAAVICTCIISALYLSVFFLLWLARQKEEAPKDEDAERYYRTIGKLQAEQDLNSAKFKPADQQGKAEEGKVAEGSKAAEPQGKTEEAQTADEGSMLGAALAASAAIRKAPMLVVLFLAVRMRALQLDPPHGLPPPHVQLCFYTVAGALTLEVLIAAYIGATSKDNVYYYGAHIFSGTKAEGTVQNFCSGVIYVCLAPVVASIFNGKAADGSFAPISPTMVAVLQLAAIFLTIEFGQWFATTFMENNMLRDTFLAAGVSITFAPLISVLFVACRMRALQITEQQGSPQPWAQDCMYLCVLATSIQVICCLLMPVFTNAATTVDADGHPEYDFRPLFGAYVVAVIKYIALFCIHAGVIGVAIAIFTMTPETARSDGNTAFSKSKNLYKIAAVSLAVVLFAMFISSAKVIGLVIKWGIESVDTLVLGTEIEVAVAKLNICEGYVNVGGLKVYNPGVELPTAELEKGEKKGEPQKGEPKKGQPKEGATKWTSEYLMKIDKVLVKVNMWKLWSSLGKSFELTAIVLQGLEVNAEKPSFKGTTNLGLIVEHLEEHARLAKKHLGVDFKEMAEKNNSKFKGKDILVKGQANKELHVEPEGGEATLDLTVHKVCIESIGGSIISPVGTLSLSAPDIVFPDFQEKMPQHRGTPEQLVVAIVKVILERVMESTAKSFLQMFPGKEIASNALGMLGRKASLCCGGSQPPKKTPVASVETPAAESKSKS